MKKIRTFGICTLILIWALLAAALWLGPKEEYTNAERRPLMQIPQISGKKRLKFRKQLLSLRFPARLPQLLSELPLPALQKPCTGRSPWPPLRRRI